MLKLQNLPDSKSCMKFHIVLLSFLVYNSFRTSWGQSFQSRQHVKWCWCLHQLFQNSECAKFLLRLDGFLQRMKFHIVLLSFLVYNSFKSSLSRSFQGRQHVKWCYVYISCFRTRSARNFFCVSMVSSSASFIGRMKTNENKEADLAGRWVRRDLS